MKVAFFGFRSFEKNTFIEANKNYHHSISFIEPRLTHVTASLAVGFDAVCVFVNDQLDKTVLLSLKKSGVQIIALRCAGFNQVDLQTAAELNLPVVRVPEYSPHAVAEHAVALILTLNRKIHRAYHRVREGNFSLEGLVGFDLYRKTVGVVGTGRIGAVMAKLMKGFGCNVVAYDLYPEPSLAAEIGFTYVPLLDLYQRSDIISLHIPLTTATRHFIDAQSFEQMKKGVMLINTGRGALVDTHALVQVLKSGHLGAAGLDVYEEEEGVFFEDLSDRVLQDDTLARLLTFPNVVITSHQAFLTQEALVQIAETTLKNLACFERKLPLENEVKFDFKFPG